MPGDGSDPMADVNCRAIYLVIVPGLHPTSRTVFRCPPVEVWCWKTLWKTFGACSGLGRRFCVDV